MSGPFRPGIGGQRPFIVTTLKEDKGMARIADITLAPGGSAGRERAA